ncbi:MAG: hypothetical protein HZC38_15255 [Chloroflexi bacterium]|nr:hypothetical protein [Chloroflexota bacterium]
MPTFKILSIIFNPLEGNRKLHQVLGWNDPDSLAKKYIDGVRECSYGYAQYEIVERVEVDGIPVKEDGFKYTTESFLKCWRSRSGFHPPYAGFYESIMVGKDAIWCNAPPLNMEVKRRFVIMGFNYERGVGEMLEDLGHRAESMLSKVFLKTRGEENLWERFTRYDKTHPNKAECGNVHFAPNSLSDYDWGNRREVLSNCDDWLNFPNFRNTTRKVSCSEWGDGDIRLHHLWWFKHFPHVEGTTNGVSNNWWEYVIKVNT